MSSFTPGPEAEELRAVVRGFLEKRCGEADVRRWMETDEGHDPAVWRQLAQELGLQGLAIDERWGGSGASTVELGVVFEEMGRVLYGGPFFGTVALASTVLSCLGDESAQERHLPGIAAGDTLATVAWGGPDPLSSTLTAERDGEGWRLSGRAGTVVDGGVAGLVLAVAGTPDGLGVFAVEGSDGLGRTSLNALDMTRKLAALEFSGTPATSVGTPGAITEGLTRALDIAVLALACEQVGGASRVLEMAVEYANTRVQFGRKIGSFQAQKHRCADMLVDTESARSTAYYGIWAATHQTDDLGVAASLAGSLCSEAYTRCTLENIQLHGGIGFTWEHAAHLYMKRARSSQRFLGSPTRHRARLGDLLDIAEANA
ncbi:MAG TPA: acyl-CoA dehydrogenase family protein [Pseudonocardia sp.]